MDLSVGKVPVRARLLRKKQEQEARARVTFVVPYEGHIGCSVLLVPAAKPVSLEDNENCRKMHAMLVDNKDGACEAARMGWVHTICHGAKDEDMSGGHPL